MRTEEKLKAFAALVEKQQAEELTKRGYDPANHDHQATIRPGQKYVKIDVGTSGKFMVDQDGTIYGIKAYGQINREKPYGTLDTTADWYWGEYYPIRAKVKA